jgi:GH24 family phage-related lysozyme (muramidase)
MIAAPLLLCAVLAPDLPDWIKAQEGYRYAPYQDARGYWTVGYGHRVRLDSPCMTRKTADLYLADDLEDACHGARSVYLELSLLPPAVRFVLVAMAFQLGPRGLAGFTAMHKALDQDDYIRAAAELMASRFASQCPTRAQDLARRLAGAKP